MGSGEIFISYRRNDSAGYARAIYDQLVQHFSKDRVFIDVDAIEPGLAFDDVIQQALERCAVLLVMIGRRWLHDDDGKASRLSDPNDLVRLEIAAALSRNIRVVPVLLDGARMPGEDELPEPLRALSRRNALEISNTRFGSDVERLVSIVRKTLGEPAAASSESSRQSGRAGINGNWEADVIYDWPNARYLEKFAFEGDDDELFGTASFLSRSRTILEGSVKKDKIRFITRTQETLGDLEKARETVHRYRGAVSGDEIRFTMQTEGGYTEHTPIEFIARRVDGK
jgi:hypothetical protein